MKGRAVLTWLGLAPLSGVLDHPTPFRWSFLRCPERPPATLCQPSGLCSAIEFASSCPNSSPLHEPRFARGLPTAPPLPFRRGEGWGEGADLGFKDAKRVKMLE